MRPTEVEQRSAEDSVVFGAWNPARAAFFARTRVHPDTPRETRLLVPRGRAVPLLWFFPPLVDGCHRLETRGRSRGQPASCYFIRDVIQRRWISLYRGIWSVSGSARSQRTRVYPRETPRKTLSNWKAGFRDTERWDPTIATWYLHLLLCIWEDETPVWFLTMTKMSLRLCLRTFKFCGSIIDDPQ